jgi:prepilin-type N-terminal cleavage/methylation domain-containing protein
MSLVYDVAYYLKKRALVMKRRSAFTLVELLVVIAIIAVLMGILLPVLGRVRKQARKIVCMSSIRGFTLAFASYSVENDDRIISLYFEDKGKFWSETLEDSYKSDDLRLCPMAKQVRAADTEFTHGNLGTSNYGGHDKSWYHIRESSEKTKMYRGSYGTNGWIHEGLSQTWGFSVSNHWKKMSVRGAAQIPMMMDCTWVAGYPLDTEKPLSATEYASFEAIGGIRGQINRYCFSRHGRVTNCSFLDGSSRAVKLEDLWSLKWHRNYQPQNDITIEWKR